MNLSDRIAHLAAVLRNAVFVLLQALGLVACPPYPGTADLPSAAFLGACLGRPVKRAEAGDLGENRGLVGGVAAVRATHGDGRPDTRLILKRTGGTAAARASDRRSGRGSREARFMAWESARRAVGEDGMPRVHFAHWSHALGEGALLMEDLRTRPDARSASEVLGDQQRAVPPEVVEPVVAAAFRWCASLHAAHWCSRDLLAERWLKGADWYAGEGRAKWEGALGAARAMWPARARRSGARADPELEAIVTRSLERSSWEGLRAAIGADGAPWTLCAGDFHAGNMHVTGGDRVAVYDFSEAGVWEPTCDLAQMVISDCRPDAFRGRTRAWVRAYWDRLVELGVRAEDYPFERCYASFCVSGVGRWVWVLAVCAALPGVPDDRFQYFCDQLIAFVREHCPGREWFEVKSVVVF